MNERIGIPAEARGEARGKTEAVLTFLRVSALFLQKIGVQNSFSIESIGAKCERYPSFRKRQGTRFKKVPKGIEKTIRSVSDPAALDIWIAQAATCQSLEEFAEAVK